MPTGCWERKLGLPEEEVQGVAYIRLMTAILLRPTPQPSKSARPDTASLYGAASD